jgi:hypothetical protein
MAPAKEELAMRALAVLSVVLISGSATADIVIGLDSALGPGKGCSIQIAGGNAVYPAVAIGARCGDGTIWTATEWPPEKGKATLAWSQENRILERLLAGEAVTIPDEHNLPH